MQEWGTVTSTVPSLSPFKGKGCGTASAHHDAWSAVVATPPQKIPRVSGCRRKSRTMKSRRPAPNLGQRAADWTRRQYVADVSHDPHI